MLKFSWASRPMGLVPVCVYCCDTWTCVVCIYRSASSTKGWPAASSSDSTMLCKYSLIPQSVYILFLLLWEHNIKNGYELRVERKLKWYYFSLLAMCLTLTRQWCLVHLRKCVLDGVGVLCFSFLSERETADRNFALGYYLKENKVSMRTLPACPPTLFVWRL